MDRKLFLVLWFLIAAFISLAQTKNLRNGDWRAVLERADGNNIVFNFEIKDSIGKKILYIKNSGERLLVDDIKLVGDSFIIKLPFFESQLHLVRQSNNDFIGFYLKRLTDNYQVMPLHAYYQQDFRFPISQNNTAIN